MSTAQQLQAAFTERFSRSAETFARARKSLASGINSNLRHSVPYPLYIERAKAARKWTIEGVELTDYWMGHGSLLFGHAIPEWDLRLAEQLSLGTHYSANSELEVSLAEKVCELVPFAERVRFCGTGSESVAVALRLARAATGRSAIVRFAGHYHGWHDELVAGILPFLDGKYLGIPASSQSLVRTLPPNDLGVLEGALKQGDVAAVLLEPAGGMTGIIDHTPEFLKAVRALATQHGCVLIFDEMVTGFRYAPGGAAEFFGVLPDLATYGKVLFGGFPGGALAGRATLMDLLGPDLQTQVAHQGTWNAAPIAMLAGGLALDLIRAKRKGLYAELHRRGESLRHALKRELEESGLAGNVFGEGSVIHLSLGDGGKSLPSTIGEVGTRIMSRMSGLNPLLRPALLLEGIDFSPFHMNVLSWAHTDEDVVATAAAFRKAFARLKAHTHERA